MEVCCEPAIFVKAKQVEASCSTLRLTRLDQLRNYYTSMIFFYQGEESSTNGELAQALASQDPRSLDHWPLLQAVRCGLEMLVEHYPWAAGRLHAVKQLHTSPDGIEEEEERLQVCIDEDGGPGLQIVGARVNCPLHCLGDLSDPNPNFEPLFATIDKSAPYHSRPLVALQVSKFECGGFCVSITLNHALFDGISTSMFLQNLGSCTRRRGLCLPLDLRPRETIIYPHNPPTQTLHGPSFFIHRKDCKPTNQEIFSRQLVGTKFVYEGHDINRLCSHALSKQKDCKRGFRTCSRSQLLTAYLWRIKARCMMVLNEDPLQDLPLRILVNVRERVVKNIPKNYVGNAFSVVTPSASLKELSEKSLAFVVELVQGAINQMTYERFQSDVNHLEIFGPNACILFPPLVISSIANMGFCDIDFGVGKQVHFGFHNKRACNLIHIAEGNAQRTSFYVFVALAHEVELLIFKDALQWELAQ